MNSIAMIGSSGGDLEGEGKVADRARVEDAGASGIRGAMLVFEEYQGRGGIVESLNCEAVVEQRVG